MHPLEDLQVVEVLVRLHEEFRKVLLCQNLALHLKIRMAIAKIRAVVALLLAKLVDHILSWIALASKHLVDLVHGQVLHE